MSFVYCVGIEPTRAPSGVALREFHDFYDEVHTPEVLVNNEGFTGARRLERAVESELPRWLALYRVDGEDAVAEYVERSAWERNRPSVSPYTPFPPAWMDMATTWRVVWREVARHGGMAAQAGPALIVGIDPPEEISGDELEAFNTFYTDVHMAEIMRRGHYTSAVRYELHSVLPTKVEGPAVPRYWTLYAGPPSLGDPAAAAESLGRAIRADGLSKGPEPWQRRHSRWRVPYRNIFSIGPDRG